MRKGIIFITCLLLLLPIVFGAEQDMQILSVSEKPDGNLTGGTAELTLEIIPGKGRIFIDTYPLTKVDTQVSTRIAKQIACDFLEIDCQYYDFIFTIVSGSSIIGGPSAGAAMTLLTIGTLDGERINQDVSISGTINSGGLIGSVGGLKEKIEAASRNNINTVLIPRGEREYLDPTRRSLLLSQNSSNTTIEAQTIDLIEHGKVYGVNVVEVGNIFEALPYLFEKSYAQSEGNITLPQFYTETMGDLATTMCMRSEQMLENLNVENFQNNDTVFYIDENGVDAIGTNFVLPNSSIDVNQTYQSAIQLLNSSKVALNYSQFYSAASYCYGAGLNLQFLHLFEKGDEEVREDVIQAFENFDVSVSDYKTITDLQTYMLVEERITEANDHLERGDELAQQNRTYNAINQYVSAIERLSSAQAWTNFAKSYGTEFNLDVGALEESCSLKIREAEERLNYLTLYLSDSGRLGTPIADARQYSRLGQYELCLHQAAIAKANIDVILSSTGVRRDRIDSHVADKEAVAEQIILRQISKGNFPIIGYSYLEYAKSLSSSNPQSSLLYLQYAIELSNIDTYLPKDHELVNIEELQPVHWFLIGFIGNFLVICIVHFSYIGIKHVVRKRNTRHKTTKHKSRKR